MAYSATFLRQPRPICLGRAQPTAGWAFPYWSAITKKKKKSHRTIWWRRFLFDTSQMCHADNQDKPMHQANLHSQPFPLTHPDPIQPKFSKTISSELLCTSITFAHLAFLAYKKFCFLQRTLFLWDQQDAPNQLHQLSWSFSSISDIVILHSLRQCMNPMSSLSTQGVYLMAVGDMVLSYPIPLRYTGHCFSYRKNSIDSESTVFVQIRH